MSPRSSPMISSASVLRAWLAHVQNTSARCAPAEVFAGYVFHIWINSLECDAKIKTWGDLDTCQRHPDCDWRSAERSSVANAHFRTQRISHKISLPCSVECGTGALCGAKWLPATRGLANHVQVKHETIQVEFCLQLHVTARRCHTCVLMTLKMKFVPIYYHAYARLLCTKEDVQIFVWSWHVCRQLMSMPIRQLAQLACGHFGNAGAMHGNSLFKTATKIVLHMCCSVHTLSHPYSLWEVVMCHVTIIEVGGIVIDT